MSKGFPLKVVKIGDCVVENIGGNGENIGCQRRFLYPHYVQRLPFPGHENKGLCGRKHWGKRRKYWLPASFPLSTLCPKASFSGS